MLRVGAIILLGNLRELLGHLIKDILGCLLVIEGLGRNENWRCDSRLSWTNAICLALLLLHEGPTSWSHNSLILLVWDSSIEILLLIMRVCAHFIIAFLRWNTNIRSYVIGRHLNLGGLLSSHHVTDWATHRVHHGCLLLLPLLKHLLRIHLAKVLLERHPWLLH